MSESTHAEPGGLVEVSRSGGFAGMTMHGRVNLDRLGESDRAEWQAAFREGFDPAVVDPPAAPKAAPAADPPAPPPADPPAPATPHPVPTRTSGLPTTPDRFVYRVRNRASGLDVTVNEQDLPEHLRDLLDRAVRPPT